ncbi:hypothetical protein LOZ53_004794 [Ophidiomyces ophidiicola]|uniref:Uncharacterized protein n=1 Tax=Ophidiomyces ophidiicola TaxID=1387563 RepID=A0ACB8UYM2_9EURO|nr:uncharacterized protein LOZ57_004906 [Ophidiomyces ophidiicola]KAI1912127.1 hypothetical protein LOZ61_003477 [Ophidiomyces ophidiicola]KAI1921784.1 hypothetical protein LOZ64_001405 [Ophidiomyces ophidiicola]KAI1925414.1 hypothetical protein LOZ60_004219 [Ophidiomyces ophidiicola]KAI1944230.1 hypothetical protein LOZ57_004906 [Ophidiomyces ophidiicola]KAI1949358.1 hypothetical protein LOZ62_002322 [Ophidiomyces ophidiicola]
MNLPHFNTSRTKTLLHAFQAFIIFLAWAMTIAVFTRDGKTDGRTAWYFALCWFSIPGLIYLTAVPIWPRARRFGNPYAFATVDGMYAFMWFTAWVAIATYVGSGKAKGENDDNNKKNGRKGCDAFAYGSPAKCRLSTGTAVLGAFVFLLFVVTTFLSLRDVMDFRRTGMMPYDGSDPTLAAQSKAAFSSNPHEMDEEGDAEFRTGRPGGLHSNHREDGDDYALLQQNEADDMHHHGARPPPSAYDPTAPIAPGPSHPAGSMAPGGLMHDYDTSYGGPYSHTSQPPTNYGHNPYNR